MESEWIGNTACILAYLYNSASTQHHEVLASQSSFLHNFWDTVLPSEAFLLWSHQLVSDPDSAVTSTWLVPVFNLCERCKARPRLISNFICKSDLFQSLVRSPWQRSIAWTLGLRVIGMAGSHLVVHLPAPLTPEEGNWEGWCS